MNRATAVSVPGRRRLDPRERFARLRQLSTIDSERIVEHASPNTRFAPDFYEWAATFPWPAVQAGIARNRHLPEHLQRHLLTTLHRPVVLEHADLSVVLQREILHRNDPDDLRSLARNPALEASSQRFLSTYPNESVQIALAGNPNLTATAQELLTYCSLPIKRTLAQHPNLSPDVFFTLLMVNDQRMNIALRSHDNLPEDLLDLLMVDPKAASQLANRPNLSDEQLRRIAITDPYAALQVVRRRDLDPEQQRWLIANLHPDGAAYAELLTSETLAPEVQVEVAIAGNLTTRRLLAHNVHLDATAIQHLAFETDPAVRASIRLLFLTIRTAVSETEVAIVSAAFPDDTELLRALATKPRATAQAPDLAARDAMLHPETRYDFAINGAASILARRLPMPWLAVLARRYETNFGR